MVKMDCKSSKAMSYGRLVSSNAIYASAISVPQRYSMTFIKVSRIRLLRMSFQRD